VGPVCFRLHARVQVEIVVPRGGPVVVEGNVRHRRAIDQPSGRRGWATGLSLATAGPDFLALARPGARPDASRRERIVEALRRAPTPPSPDVLLSEHSLYRVRLKAVGSARTRTLTLRAASEAAVCEAVLRDLPGDWEVLGVEVDPID
jgi:hypothetical protein